MFNWNPYDLFTTNSSNTNCTISTSRLHQSIHNTGYLTENHQRRTFPKKKTEKPSCIPIGTPKKSPKTQYSIPLETEYATPILSLYERYTTTEHDKQRGKRYDSWFYWLFIVVPASSEHDAAKKNAATAPQYNQRNLPIHRQLCLCNSNSMPSTAYAYALTTHPRWWLSCWLSWSNERVQFELYKLHITTSKPSSSRSHHRHHHREPTPVRVLDVGYAGERTNDSPSVRFDAGRCVVANNDNDDDGA